MNNVVRLSHEERRMRRKAIADYVIQNMHVAKNILEESAQLFGVTIETAKKSCKENGVNLDAVFVKQKQMEEEEKNDKINNKMSEKKAQVADLLRNTTKTYEEIGNIVGVTKERVRQIRRDLAQEGVEFPDRDEISAKKTLKRAEVFLEEFKKTNNFFESRKKAKIGSFLAKNVLKEADIDAYGKPKRITQFTKSTVALEMLASLFNETLTCADITRIHNVSKPAVFNLMQLAYNLGIPIPRHPDGRFMSCLACFVDGAILISLLNSNGIMLSVELNSKVYEELEKYPDLLKGHNFNPKRLTSYVCVRKTKLEDNGYISVDRHIPSPKMISVSLTDTGWSKAMLLPDDHLEKIAALASSESFESIETNNNVETV